MLSQLRGATPFSPLIPVTITGRDVNNRREISNLEKLLDESEILFFNTQLEHVFDKPKNSSFKQTKKNSIPNTPGRLRSEDMSEQTSIFKHRTFSEGS